MLLVDDVDVVRGSLRGLLELEGIEVVGEARDGAGALTEAVRLRPDLVLLDWRMPGMDGLEATRRLRALGVTATVIVCTAFGGSSFEDEALAAGADLIFTKGDPPRLLIDEIWRLWGSHRVQAPPR